MYLDSRHTAIDPRYQRYTKAEGSPRFEMQSAGRRETLIEGGRRDRAEISRRYPRGDIEREKRKGRAALRSKAKTTHYQAYLPRPFQQRTRRRSTNRVNEPTSSRARVPRTERNAAHAIIIGAADPIVRVPSSGCLGFSNETVVDVRLRGISC